MGRAKVHCGATPPSVMVLLKYYTRECVLLGAADDDNGENRKVLSLSSLIHSGDLRHLVGLSHITELAKYRKTGRTAAL